jgi:hypothetical protein
MTISNSAYNMPALGDKGGIPDNIDQLELITTIREINSESIIQHNFNPLNQ